MSAFKYLNDATIGAGAVTTNVLPAPTAVAPGTWAYDSVSGPVWCSGSSWVPLSTNSGTTNIFLSAWPGIDATGVTDSRAALAAALAFVAGTNNTLVVDCPCLISVGTDLTKTIFVASGTNLDFTSTGAFIMDAHGIPTFAFIGVTNCTWTDYTVRYIGNPGSVMLQYTGTWATNNGNWNTLTLTNYLKANNGNSFSGATAIWPGPTNTSALHYIGGASSNINFIGSCSATAVYATADRFIPVLFSINVQWLYGQAVTSGTVVNSSTAAQPTNICFDGWTSDGVYMTMVGGGGNIKIRNWVSLRYGDLEDSSGNNQGGIGTTSGRSGNQCSDQWFAPPHLFYLQSGNSSFVCSVDYANILDEGIYTSNNANYGSRRAVTSGYINSLKFDASGVTTVTNYISKRPDGFCDVLSQSSGAIAPGCFMENVSVYLDCGVGGFYTTVSAAGAGSTSFTITPANWMCNNSGGSYAGIASGTYPTTFSTGEVRAVTYTVTVVGNSATAISASWTQPLLNANTTLVRIGVTSAGRFAFRYPGASIQNVYLKNVKIFDSSLFPYCWPLLSDSSVGHVNFFVNFELIVQDYPTIATYTPGFGIAGEGISLKTKVIFLNCSSTQTFRGPIANVSSTPTFDHYSEVELYGWRQTSITFQSAPTGTSANILTAMWPTGVTGWIYPSGTYNVLFSDNEVRAVTFTNGSAACTWSGALSGTPTVSAQVCLINSAQFDAFRPRIQLPQTNGLVNFGVRAKVIDVSNGGEFNINQGLLEESWTQFWQGTPPAGATYTTPITYPTTFAIDRVSWGVTTNFGTISNINVGQVGGSATAFFTGVNVTTGAQAPRPIATPVTVTGAVLLTPNVSFDGTGVGVVSTRGVRTNLGPA
jgi:hypothetical protein